LGSLEKARKVVELSGTKRNVEFTMKHMIGELKKDMVGAPAHEMERLAEVAENVFSSHIDRMIEVTISGFVSTFSDEDLDTLIGWYDSPAGKSIMEKLPTVMEINSREISKYCNAVLYPELHRKMEEMVREIEEEAKKDEDASSKGELE